MPARWPRIHSLLLAAMLIGFVAGGAACDDEPEGVVAKAGSPASPTATGTVHREATPERTATPDPTRWRNGTERCPMPAAVTVPPRGVAAGDATQAFCVVWANDYADEAGFRVEVRYHEGGERFVHTIGPDEHDFVFPAEEEPISAGAGCMTRRSYTIQVFVLRPGGDEPAGAVGASVECGP